MNMKTIIKIIAIGGVIVALVTGLLVALKLEDFNSSSIKLKNQNEIINAKSYNEIYKILTSSSNENKTSLWDSIFGYNDYSDEGDEDEIDDDSQYFYETDYSVENVGTPGIDEGDIVKTDEKYLYVSDESSSVYIYDMESVDKILVAKITLEDVYGAISDMYVNGRNLILICDDYEYYGETIIYNYDLSRIDLPELISEVHQSGSYIDSRLVGNILYTFSDYIVYDFSRRNCVPFINEEIIRAEDVYYIGEVSEPEYSVITSLNIDDSEEFIDNKAVLGSAEDTYISDENIYFAELNSEEGTNVIKFSYHEGIIEGKAFGKVDGVVKDSYAMNEHEGNLRIVTMDNVSDNSVYVLNEELKTIGAIHGINIGEEIYSSRYLGNVLYFVINENVEPLIAIDLSEPTKPTIIRGFAVEIFPKYLRFWSESLILGIEEETNPETGESLGVKLSMFDISNPSQVKLVSYLVLENYGYTSAESSHKTVLIEPDKNLIGLSLESDYESEGYYVDYLVITYNETSGFETKIIDSVYNETTGDGEYSYLGYDLTYGTRGICLGDKLYVISHDYRISEYDLNSFENIKKYDIFDENMSLPEV